MSEGKTPRGTRMDQLLADWPTAPRSAVDWDDAADQVMSHIELDTPARTADLVSDEDLVRAPLPLLPGEVQSSAATEHRSEATTMSNVSRERDRASLKDLAKMANAPSSARLPSSSPSSGVIFGTPMPTPSPEPEGKQENSGMINLAALAAAEESARPAVALPPLTREAMSTMRSIAPPAPESGQSQRASKTSKGMTLWIPVSGVVAVAAVTAGVFFGMHRGSRSTLGGPVAVMGPQAPAAATQVLVPAQPAKAQPPMAAPLAPADQGVDPSTLPQAQSQAQLAAAGPHGAVPVTAAAPAKPGAAATAAAPTTPPTLVANIPPPVAPTSTSSEQNLQALMQQAAGSSPAATAAAATTEAPSGPAPGSVPIKPSQGAIQGALGAALPGARACLGADDPISHATVTFASDGSVQSVSVSGGAAGKPAEGCIRAALTRARVTPFAQPTFTASTTVRPN